MARADKLTAGQVAQIRSRRATGELRSSIAADFDIAPQTVGHHTRDIPPPPHGWRRGGRIAQPPAMRFIELHERYGLTYTVIAERFGRPIKSVRRTVEKHRRLELEVTAC